MLSRTAQRELVLQALYMFEHYNQGIDTMQLVDNVWSLRDPDRKSKYHSSEFRYAHELLDMIIAHIDEIDSKCVQYLSIHKSASQLNPVDRDVLRIGATEILLFKMDASVVINEAIMLAKKFSTIDSYKLINAILDTFVKQEMGSTLDG